MGQKFLFSPLQAAEAEPMLGLGWHLDTITSLQVDVPPWLPQLMVQRELFPSVAVKREDWSPGFQRTLTFSSSVFLACALTCLAFPACMCSIHMFLWPQPICFLVNILIQIHFSRILTLLWHYQEGIFLSLYKYQHCIFFFYWWVTNSGLKQHKCIIL